MAQNKKKKIVASMTVTDDETDDHRLLGLQYKIVSKNLSSNSFSVCEGKFEGNRTLILYVVVLGSASRILPNFKYVVYSQFPRILCGDDIFAKLICFWMRNVAICWMLFVLTCHYYYHLLAPTTTMTATMVIRRRVGSWPLSLRISELNPIRCDCGRCALNNSSYIDKIKYFRTDTEKTP